MGIRSHCESVDFDVVDKEALNKYKAYLEGIGATQLAKLLEKDTFDPYKMDGWKLVGYWYDDIQNFFRHIAVFIEGMIEFQNEEGEFAKVYFEKGETRYVISEVRWTYLSADGLHQSVPNHGDAVPPVPRELPDFLEELKVRRNI